MQESHSCNFLRPHTKNHLPPPMRTVGSRLIWRKWKWCRCEEDQDVYVMRLSRSETQIGCWWKALHVWSKSCWNGVVVSEYFDWCEQVQDHKTWCGLHLNSRRMVQVWESKDSASLLYGGTKVGFREPHNMFSVMPTQGDIFRNRTMLCMNRLMVKLIAIDEGRECDSDIVGFIQHPSIRDLYRSCWSTTHKKNKNGHVHVHVCMCRSWCWHLV